MNRKRALVILLLGLISGLVATVGAARYLSDMEKATASVEPPKPESVVITKTDVAQGEKLRGEDLEVASWPASLVPPSTFKRLEDVESRVTSVRLLKGEPILAGKLAPVGSSAGLAAVIPPGMRGVTVGVNDVSGVAGFVLPGSRVDVITTIDIDPKKGPTDTVSKVILHDIQVLAVGQRMDADGKKAKKVSVVTLLVSPAQAEHLTLASTRGTIQLALRSTPDKSVSSTRGVTPPQLIYGFTPTPPKAVERKRRPKTPRRKAQIAPVATPPAQKPMVIEIIRGTERSLEPVGYSRGEKR